MTKESTRWTRDALLAEARRRMSALPDPSKQAIEHMLENLVREAGWEGDELVDVLCTDVIRRSTRPPPKKSGTISKVAHRTEEKNAANNRRK